MTANVFPLPKVLGTSCETDAVRTIRGLQLSSTMLSELAQQVPKDMTINVRSEA